MVKMVKPANHNRLRAAIHAAGLLYAFGLAALLLANYFLRQTSPFVALASTFNLYLFLAGLPLVVGLLLLRTRTALATLALLAALFLSANPVLPPVAATLPAKASGATVTAMTFNLGGGITPARLLAQTIAAAPADIVAVQELTADSAAVLGAELATLYPYQILDPAVGSTGLLSKLPIVSFQWLRPPGSRALLHVVVAQDGTALHVFAVHLLTPGILWWPSLHLPRGLVETSLEREVAALRQQVAAVTAPVIVLGDFNMSDQSRAYSALTTSLQDSFREAGTGLGRTFPNSLHLGRVRIPGPLVRIDYVFHSPQLQATAATVNCIEGQSDHCAVVVILGVKAGQQESARE